MKPTLSANSLRLIPNCFRNEISLLAKSYFAFSKSSSLGTGEEISPPETNLWTPPKTYEQRSESIPPNLDFSETAPKSQSSAQTGPHRDSGRIRSRISVRVILGPRVRKKL
ncbi:hypothetical protein ACFQ9J_35570 [Streptomyces sp. NPDC056529]|uniref:hypothetical protein n=1 Tax=Streptomyces sp. NPDC056529 TaxID=3345855 RepID=UPI0036C25732